MKLNSWNGLTSGSSSAEIKHLCIKTELLICLPTNTKLQALLLLQPECKKQLVILPALLLLL